MSRQIIYKEDELLGNSAYNSEAMQDLAKKDHGKHVLNQKNERRQLFKELKKYRKGGVTRKELKGILAGLKYGSGDYFDAGEINMLAKELNLGTISKKHLMTKSPTHSSKIERANHDANYSRNNPSGKIKNERSKRNMPNDDIVNYEVQKGIQKVFGNKYKKMIVDGDMIFEDEQVERGFFDKRTGRKFFGKSSQLKRPNFHMKSQASLRGRGWVAGSRSL